jgi:4-amino-4-deoxy-L-arabinose transferase-like glycosyltransferase
MLLTLFLMLCLCFSWWGVERSMQEKNGVPLFLAGCFFAGLAMLTKGAIGAVFPLITACIYLLSIGRLSLLFKRSWILPGAAILTVVGFSWYLLLGFVHPDGFSFMKDLFIKHHIERFSTPLEGHSGPIYFYLIVLLVGFMPWSVFVPLAAFHGQYRNSSSERIRFIRLFLLFSLITFIFFSVAATKLPNYICPALPGIAIFTATLFDEKEKTGKWAWSTATYMAAILVLGLGLVLLLSPLIIAHLPQMLGKSALKAPILAQPVALGYAPYISGVIMIAAGILLASANRAQKKETLFYTLSATSLLVTGTLFLIVLPLYARLMDQPLTRLAAHAAAKTPENGRIVLLQVSGRPSVNFTAHRRTIGCGVDDINALRQIFQDQNTRVGITTEYYLNKIRQSGVAVEQLLSDHGYTLFKLQAESRPQTSPPGQEKLPDAESNISP